MSENRKPVPSLTSGGCFVILGFILGSMHTGQVLYHRATYTAINIFMIPNTEYKS